MFKDKEYDIKGNLINTSLDYVDEDYDTMLAESTRDDLIDAFVEKLESLSKEELIKVLIKTQGTINVKTPNLWGE